MELTPMNVIIYLMSIFSGCFLGVMVLTFIEDKSSKFKKLTNKIHESLPKSGWRTLVLLTLVGAGVVIALFTSFGATRGGILVGTLGGIIIHFKAGVSKEVYDAASYGQPKPKSKKHKK